MFRSTPEMGGPLTSTHKQGWPRALSELQQASLGGMGLKGATAALQGISWMSAEKKVLAQVGTGPCCFYKHLTLITNINTKTSIIIVLKCFICLLFYLFFSPFYLVLIYKKFRVLQQISHLGFRLYRSFGSHAIMHCHPTQISHV